MNFEGEKFIFGTETKDNQSVNFSAEKGGNCKGNYLNGWAYTSVNSNVVMIFVSRDMKG